MIENPNTSGQGFDADHALNPYHAIILAFGYVYSHSTPITYGNGLRTVMHSYAAGEHRVSVTTYYSYARWSTTTSTGSGRHTTGPDSASLLKHLTSKARRYPELRTARIAAQQTGDSKP